MAYAFVQDVAASWKRYELETAVAIYPAPKGLILHLAGPTAEGFRVIEVWEDEAAWLRFRDGRLAPVLASTTRPALPELPPLNIVPGARWGALVVLPPLAHRATSQTRR